MEETKAAAVIAEELPAEGRLPEKKKRRITSEEIWGTAFAAIPVLGLLLFSLVPMAISLVSVFFDMRGVSFTSLEWNSFRHFKDLAADGMFWRSIGISVYLTSAQVISLLVALAVSMLLGQRLRGSKLFTVVFFIPYICSTVAISIMWKWMFNTNYGIINDILTSMFGEGARVAWMSDENWIVPTLLIVMVWNMPGYGITLLNAAINNVNRTYYEAAELDGATKPRMFWSITLPAISPTLFFLLMVGIINGMQTFDVINVFYPSDWVLGGGTGNAAVSTVFYIYDTATRLVNMPLASLMSWVLFLIILVVSVLNFKLSDRWVSYD